MTHHIVIYTDDIHTGCKYMMDNSNRLDLLGQILFTGYNIKIHHHMESPAEQQDLIHPFTTLRRNRCYNTPLTLQLLLMQTPSQEVSS